MASEYRIPRLESNTNVRRKDINGQTMFDGIVAKGLQISVDNSPYHKESGLRLNHVCESARSTWTYNALPVQVPYAHAGSQQKVFQRRERFPRREQAKFRLLTTP